MIMVKVAMAHLDLPLCEKQSDLTRYVSRILKQNTKISVVKREVGLLFVYIIALYICIWYGCM